MSPELISNTVATLYLMVILSTAYGAVWVTKLALGWTIERATELAMKIVA